MVFSSVAIRRSPRDVAAKGALIPAQSTTQRLPFVLPDATRVSISGWSLGLKRTFDVVISALLLLAFFPVMSIVAILIALQRDNGTIFYGQRRVGRSGRLFYCLKFRSMCPEADARLKSLLATDAGARKEWAETHKLKNDPRITSLGRFLRDTSLDELPQLWNVFRGQMSLVGPRPITIAELDGPYLRHSGQEEYLAVRPGITGLWQVSGRSLVTYENRVALDKAYVRNFSLVADASILVKTVGVVLLRKGAC